MKNQGQCSSCLALSTTGAQGEALAVDNGWTQTMSEQQVVDCDTIDSACDSGLMEMDSISQNRMHCARRSVLQRHGRCLQGFECNGEIAQGSVTRHKDTSTDSETALMSAVAQQTVSITEEETRTLL